MFAARAMMDPRRWSLWLAAVAVAPMLLGGTPAKAQEPILLMVDHAEIIRITRPANTVIIGNPAIADATIRDSQTLILTGRSYGTTNLIVLDEDGQPIADELVTVAGSEQSVVTVFKRAARETYSCAPICEPTLNVGDQQTSFDTISTQVQTRGSLARGE